MAKTKQEYGNESISMLEGADRVRKRPGVIFGSDGLEGCEHAVFEILSNSIDEAREGYGNEIIVTRYRDGRIQVEDFGRGCPVDWNEKVGRYNWELVFCELYAGGKYENNTGENYEYSLGLNGLGSCATQYASDFFDVTVRRDGFRYDLHFEKGRNKGGLKKEPTDRGRKTGSVFHWRPDKQVFTDINIPVEYYRDVLKRQAVVNPGITFRFRNQVGNKFETTEFRYEKGIVESTRQNARTIASIFGKEAEVDAMFSDYQPRIDALNTVLNGKNVLLGMYNSNALGLMGTASQLNMIANELGANNLSESVGETQKATHGEEASWETIITLNPEYMFILDRSTATGASDEGVMGAREVIENELGKELDVYKNGKIVYFIEHANVWYTSTGGVQALDTMLADLEGALLHETSK